MNACDKGERRNRLANFFMGEPLFSFLCSLLGLVRIREKNPRLAPGTGEGQSRHPGRAAQRDWPGRGYDDWGSGMTVRRSF